LTFTSLRCKFKYTTFRGNVKGREEENVSVAQQKEVISYNMNHPLGRWRWRHEVSQKELAERCGLTQQAISAYEVGERVPRGEELKRLHAVTGIPIEALVLPKEYLEAHPDYLLGPRPPERRGRPRKLRPSEED